MVFPALFIFNHVLKWIDLCYLCQDLLHICWTQGKMKMQGPWLKSEEFQDGTNTALMQGQFHSEQGAPCNLAGCVSTQLALIFSPDLLLLCLSVNEAHSLWVLFSVSDLFDTFTQATCVYHSFSCTVLLWTTILLKWGKGIRTNLTMLSGSYFPLRDILRVPRSS